MISACAEEDSDSANLLSQPTGSSGAAEEGSGDESAAPQTRGARLNARLFPGVDLRLNIGICSALRNDEEVLEAGLAAGNSLTGCGY